MRAAACPAPRYSKIDLPLVPLKQCDETECFLKSGEKLKRRNGLLHNSSVPERKFCKRHGQTSIREKMNNPKFHSIKVWEASLANRAESTKQNYSKYFRGFLKWAGLTPDQLRETKWQEDQAGKPWERSRVENLLRQYLKSLDGYSCNTQRCAFTAVRSFFEANGVPLNLKQQDRPSGCAFGSKTLDPEENRKLKNAAEYLRDKALIMFLKDSGVRLSDACMHAYFRVFDQLRKNLVINTFQFLHIASHTNLLCSLLFSQVFQG